MNKAKLIDKLSKRTHFKKRELELLIKELFNLITEELSREESVNIIGFGSFQTKYRHARMGVDPRDPKKRIEMPETYVAKFKAGYRLKNALKNIKKENI